MSDTMIILQIIFSASIISIAYQIMIRQGEILQGWARYVNLNIKYSTLQKLLLCPYCLGGQLALWSSIYYIIKGHGVECLISVPTTIVVVYFVVHKWFK